LVICSSSLAMVTDCVSVVRLLARDVVCSVNASYSALFCQTCRHYHHKLSTFTSQQHILWTFNLPALSALMLNNFADHHIHLSVKKPEDSSTHSS